MRKLVEQPYMLAKVSKDMLRPFLHPSFHSMLYAFNMYI